MALFYVILMLMFQGNYFNTYFKSSNTLKLFYISKCICACFGLSLVVYNKYKVFNSASPTFLLLILLECINVKIKHFWVPDPMANGSVDTALLDCDYTLEDRDKETLEVKWYFKHNPSPIYQWIPPNPPQVSSITLNQKV